MAATDRVEFCDVTAHPTYSCQVWSYTNLCLVAFLVFARIAKHTGTQTSLETIPTLHSMGGVQTMTHSHLTKHHAARSRVSGLLSIHVMRPRSF